MTYPEWLSEVRKELARIHPGLDPDSVDPNAAYKAWQSRESPSAFAVRAAQGAVTTTPKGASSPNNPASGLQGKLPLRYRDKFHFGAFGLTWLWGINHERYGLLWIQVFPAIQILLFLAYVLSVELVAPLDSASLARPPILFFVSNLILWIAYLGVRFWIALSAFEWAWQSGRFASQKEFDDVERNWTVWSICKLMAEFPFQLYLLLAYGGGLAMVIRYFHHP